MKIRKQYVLFMISIFLLPMLVVTNVQAQHYTEEFGWAFPNYVTPTLSWEIYRDTFIGIPPTRNPASSGFDVLFYDHVYRDQLAAQGNCYGLSVMSLLMRKKGGHLGYCLPVSQFPGDLVPNGNGRFDGPTELLLSRAINQVHGHQVNVPSLKQYLELIAVSKNRDGEFAFDKAQYYNSMNDYTVVSITKTLSPLDGGHTMVAYDTRDFGPNDKRIYVYDPNRSWYHPTQQSFYTSGSNYIRIKADRSWSFEKVSDNIITNPTNELVVWDGSPSSGGNCIITPLSICGPRSRTPSSLGVNALSFANQFFIVGEGANLLQVTNAEGKRLFKPGTIEIDVDPETGMLNMVPWYPSDNGNVPYNFVNYFQFGEPGGALELQVKSGKDGYRFDLASHKSHLRIQSFGGTGVEVMKIEEPGTSEPLISLQNTTNSERYEIQFTQIVKENEETRVFRVKDLSIPSENPVQFKIAENQDVLQVASETTKLTYDLEIEKISNHAIEKVEFRDLVSNPGEMKRIRPMDWKTMEDIEIHTETDLGVQK